MCTLFSTGKNSRGRPRFQFAEPRCFMCFFDLPPNNILFMRGWSLFFQEAYSWFSSAPVNFTFHAIPQRNTSNKTTVFLSNVMEGANANWEFSGFNVKIWKSNMSWVNISSSFGQTLVHQIATSSVMLLVTNGKHKLAITDSLVNEVQMVNTMIESVNSILNVSSCEFGASDSPFPDEEEVSPDRSDTFIQANSSIVNIKNCQMTQRNFTFLKATNSNISIASYLGRSGLIQATNRSSTYLHVVSFRQN